MKNDIIFIEHMKESIKNIEIFSKGVSEEKFRKERFIQSAIIREIEIIGEAAKNMSHNLKEKYPKIEWKEISGMRDKLIHHYFGVNIERVWMVVKNDLPTLKKNIKEIMKREIK